MVRVVCYKVKPLAKLHRKYVLVLKKRKVIKNPTACPANHQDINK